MTAAERQSDKDDMRNVQQAIGGNREAMRLFEKCINTNDLELGRRLIAETAAFKTPVSQGDEWDAQKDMLCDMSGAVCSVSSFLSFNSNEDARRSCNV